MNKKKKLLAWARAAKEIFENSGESDFEELRKREKREIITLIDKNGLDYEIDGDSDYITQVVNVEDCRVCFFSRAEYTEDFNDYAYDMELSINWEDATLDDLISHLNGKVIIKNFNYTTALTHSGVFHADDVFSAAFLRMLNPDIKISRAFKAPDETSADTIIFDIGFGQYDHHQKDAEVRDNGIKYAAFGLLWRDFSYKIMSEEYAGRFDREFIQPLDNTDNGGDINAMYSSIMSFAPNWDEENQNMDEAFFRAVDFAEDVLRREFRRIEASEKAEQEVRTALENSGGEIVVLERFCPWESVLIPSTAKFVVFPSLRGGYSAQAVPTVIGGRDQKIPFPTKWAGKKSQELQEYVNGMTFCHPGGFMVSTKTVEQAVSACKKALEMKYKKGEYKDE